MTEQPLTNRQNRAGKTHTTGQHLLPEYKDACMYIQEHWWEPLCHTANRPKLYDILFDKYMFNAEGLLDFENPIYGKVIDLLCMAYTHICKQYGPERLDDFKPFWHLSAKQGGPAIYFKSESDTVDEKFALWKPAGGYLDMKAELDALRAKRDAGIELEIPEDRRKYIVEAEERERDGRDVGVEGGVRLKTRPVRYMVKTPVVGTFNTKPPVAALVKAKPPVVTMVKTKPPLEHRVKEKSPAPQSPPTESKPDVQVPAKTSAPQGPGSPKSELDDGDWELVQDKDLDMSDCSDKDDDLYEEARKEPARAEGQQGTPKKGLLARFSPW